MTKPIRPVFAVIFALGVKGVTTTIFYPRIGVAGMTVGPILVHSPINDGPFSGIVVILIRRHVNKDVGILRIDFLGDKTAVYRLYLLC